MSAPAARVLVIDDTPEARITVKAVLGRERYELFEADSGQTGLEVARRIVPDLVVLDLGLPDIDGIEVCRALRTFSDAYVIMLTARDREMDILSGLTIGADDYMTKPFSPLELAARVRAAFRRAAARSVAPIGEKIYRFGDLTVDTKRREARVAGEKVQLRPDELDVLFTLAQSPSHVFTRADLLEAVWGSGPGADDPLVDECLAELRLKLGDVTHPPRLIATIGADGYQIVTNTVPTSTR
ncbi:MAG: response regulator transcription factor [Actinomycetota bacterium]|nr:response regulator transcription factor [Actinomycetota bacterium]